MRDARLNELLDEVREVKREVAELRGERDAVRDELTLARKVKDLREQIETLEVEKARVVEEREREKREVEHLVGLQRKRSEFEREQAVSEATLAVREENLTADKQRFAEQMEFHRAELQKQIDYLQSLMKKVLERVPTVTWEHTSNGRKAEEIDA